EMVCWATGGPQKYTGRSMKDSHQHLMITATEWEAFLDDLQQTLDKFKVPQAEQTEIKAIVASTRADIVVKRARRRTTACGSTVSRSNSPACPREMHITPLISAWPSNLGNRRNNTKPRLPKSMMASCLTSAIRLGQQ